MTLELAPKATAPAAAAAVVSAAGSGEACDVCNARVGELRRGRCWGCYQRWVETRPVGMGARCVTCAEKRRRVLKQVELYGSWKPMCFNCAGQLLHLEPMPTTISELKKIISRERRDADRRVGKADTRVFQYERRVGARRMGREPMMSIDDDMILEITIDAEDLVPLEATEAASGSGPNKQEMTAIVRAEDIAAESDSIEVDLATSTDDGEVDFESDLTAIRSLIADLKPSDLAG